MHVSVSMYTQNSTWHPIGTDLYLLLFYKCSHMERPGAHTPHCQRWVKGTHEKWGYVRGDSLCSVYTHNVCIFTGIHSGVCLKF